ncbi:hypothetical protein [Streptomyces sp. NA02950]|uniref:hypothetical protein n=1 Tax=Streptomyces sp. NA02950 TaxID=2742137 RepID=UPI0020CAA4C7|nr:hypothetical protein [Streptomyces sp. NA02950]
MSRPALGRPVTGVAAVSCATALLAVGCGGFGGVGPGGGTTVSVAVVPNPRSSENWPPTRPVTAAAG